MISKKKIRDKSPDEFIQDLFEVNRWLETFNDAGTQIFGEDYELTTAMIGIAILGLSENVNTFFDRAETMANEMRKRKESRKDFLSGFGIKLADDDDPTIPS